MQGSTLVVKVTENPIINRVAFEGNSKIEDDKLRDEVQSKPRQVFTRARVQADVERILTIYRRSGRYNASVEPKIIKLEQGRVDLVFEINEGDVTGVQRISFVGNEHFSATARCAARSAPPRAPGGASCRRTIATTPIASISTASCCASSTCPRATPISASYRRWPSSRPTAQGFFITFTISEGERYKFGKVDVSTRFQGLDVDVLQELPHHVARRVVRRQRGREDRGGAHRRRRLARIRFRRRASATSAATRTRSRSTSRSTSRKGLGSMSSASTSRATRALWTR